VCRLCNLNAMTATDARDGLPITVIRVSRLRTPAAYLNLKLGLARNDLRLVTVTELEFEGASIMRKTGAFNVAEPPEVACAH
jgi:hypothetical protein